MKIQKHLGLSDSFKTDAPLLASRSHRLNHVRVGVAGRHMNRRRLKDDGWECSFIMQLPIKIRSCDVTTMGVLD